MLFKSPKSQMVELIIGANGVIPGPNSRTYFADQPQLQTYRGDKTVYIKAIETFDDTSLVSSPLTSLSPTATPADLINGVLVLTVAGTEQQQFVPLAVMNRMWGNPGTSTPNTWQPYLLENVFETDWTKSYVMTLASPAAVPFSYLFLVHYDYLPNT